MQSHPEGYETSPRFVIGIMIMLVGFGIGYQSDNELCRLRSQQMGYQIPYGGMFEYVSTPHFLGEVVEWVGYAIAAQSWAAWSFPIWTAANLIPRSYLQHEWYLTTFGDKYPKNRTAFFPNFIR